MEFIYNKNSYSLNFNSTRNLFLDSVGRDVFFSHAHSDHLNLSAHSILASKTTLSLLESKKNRKNFKILNQFEWSEDGINFELLDSGHVLGGKQLLVYNQGKSFVYTGDLNPAGSLVCSPAQIPCDVDELLIESTFGKPEYSFLPPLQVAKQISNWVKTNLQKGNSLVLGGHALGKAQELIKILNEHNGITPIVNDQIASVSNEYVKEGIKLDYISSTSEEGKQNLTNQFVAVLPQNQVNSNLRKKLSDFYKKEVKIAIATGWATSMKFTNYDAAFALSSHADFNSLVSYVNACNPKKIYCNHGFSSEFSSHLRSLGYDAISIR